jgi:hypothetical protein
MSKQTAVEWLVEQLECFGNKHELQLSWATVDELVEQAKAMEKEQIETAYISGRDAWQSYQVQIRTHEPKKPNPVKYYKETYGGEDGK